MTFQIPSCMKGYHKNTVAHKSCNKHTRTQKSLQKIAVMGMGLKMETFFMIAIDS